LFLLTLDVFCLQVFTLPSLKPYCKFKLTATEGTRVRKVNINQFTLRTGKYYFSSFILLTFCFLIQIISMNLIRNHVLFVWIIWVK
jgi:hypothetical protein